MIGYKDILLDMSDSEYEEAVDFLNDVLTDDVEAIRQWEEGMDTFYQQQITSNFNEVS